ncbi:CD209 antigen-like protein E isoform X2 [Hypomesus transpacificus]|uniref:CD209 antigen-like protein E isoform X2 n=1 Tax=Hypomesus transpacificus TaxID=137520 RepID=UPI001F0744DA|nr:CD209 antigen-like protein E isoform X2 [Hypomesus transpacificus]
MAVFRSPREMEVEDLNIDEDPTMDVQTETPDQALEKTPKSETGSYRWVIVSFGLLCVLQATLYISLRLAFSNNHLETNYTILSRERDQLQTNHTNLTRETDDLYRRLYELTSCPDGWLKFVWSCYYVSTEIKNWAASKQDCIGRGADLVIINNREEQVFLDNLNKRVWIGLTDTVTEGTFIWVDGTPLTTPKFWIPGQPDNKQYSGNLDEDCGEIFPTYFSAAPPQTWNDAPCKNINYWVCERRM